MCSPSTDSMLAQENEQMNECLAQNLEQEALMWTDRQCQQAQTAQGAKC